MARGDLNLERLSAPTAHEASPALQEGRPEPHPIRIPLQPTPLIGRDAELAAMERIFKNPECRLLTLAGMGGVGKTRLAIEFAFGQRAAFSGGVYFVPLAPVNSTEAIVPAVADAIGFGFSGPCLLYTSPSPRD